MPTSPRDLTDGECRLLCENLPFCHRTSRADVGIGPYAVGETILSILPRPNSFGVPSTPAAAAAPSESTEGRGCSEESYKKEDNCYDKTTHHQPRLHLYQGELF